MGTATYKHFPFINRSYTSLNIRSKSWMIYFDGVLGKTWAYCCLSARLMGFGHSEEKTISGDEGRKLCGSKVYNLFWSQSQNQEHFNTQWTKLWEESVKEDMKAFIHLKAEQTRQLDHFNSLCQEERKKTLRK